MHVAMSSQSELLGTVRPLSSLALGPLTRRPSQIAQELTFPPPSSLCASQVFPTYRPGFEGLKPYSNDRQGTAAPIPLLVQTELTGLLNLCRLEVRSSLLLARPFREAKLTLHL